MKAEKKKKWTWKICQYCGEAYIGPSNSKFCTKECRDSSNGRFPKEKVKKIHYSTNEVIQIGMEANRVNKSYGVYVGEREMKRQKMAELRNINLQKTK